MATTPSYTDPAATRADVEVIPPPYRGVTPSPLPAHPVDGQTPTTTPMSGYRTYFHPYSGAAILGIDATTWGAIELPSAEVLMPLKIVLAFILTFGIVYNIQRRLSPDSVASAAFKAFIGAFAAALPFLVTGTALGGLILLASGTPINPMQLITGRSGKK